jgi:hypothetical protein
VALRLLRVKVTMIENLGIGLSGSVAGSLGNLLLDVAATLADIRWQLTDMLLAGLGRNG